MIAHEIVRREQRNRAGTATQGRMHTLDESAILKVPVLDDNTLGRIFENMGDALSYLRV